MWTSREQGKDMETDGDAGCITGCSEKEMRFEWSPRRNKHKQIKTWYYFCGLSVIYDVV